MFARGLLDNVNGVLVVIYVRPDRGPTKSRGVLMPESVGQHFLARGQSSGPLYDVIGDTHRLLRQSTDVYVCLSVFTVHVRFLSLAACSGVVNK